MNSLSKYTLAILAATLASVSHAGATTESFGIIGWAHPFCPTGSENFSIVNDTRTGCTSFPQANVFSVNATYNTDDFIIEIFSNEACNRTEGLTRPVTPGHCVQLKDPSSGDIYETKSFYVTSK